MHKIILLTATALLLAPGAALAADVAGDAASGLAGFAGFYTGINAGYASGTLSDANSPATFPNVALAGAFVGGQAGYNFTLVDGVVAGIQGDLDWANETGSSGAMTRTVGPVHDATLNDTVKWTGALTGHLGVTANGMMLYALAGIAGAGNSLQNLGNDGLGGAQPVESDVSQTHLGWTAGAGVSALLGSIETFLEYRYTEYGGANYSAALGDEPVSLIDQSVRLGFNYHMH